MYNKTGFMVLLVFHVLLSQFFVKLIVDARRETQLLNIVEEDVDSDIGEH